MSSKRLPGKVLSEVAGFPLLGHLVNRLRRSKRLAALVIATSTESSDDPIVDFCDNNQVRVVRAELDDVAARFKATLTLHSAPYFARICADSPLYDVTLLDQAIMLFEKDSFDLVTNVRVRSYPKGMSIEILNSKMFLQSLELFSSPEEREHITSYFYQHSGDFRFGELPLCIPNYSSLNLSIDSETDLNRFKLLAERFGERLAQASWKELVQATLDLTQVSHT